MCAGIQYCKAEGWGMQAAAGGPEGPDRPQRTWTLSPVTFSCGPGLCPLLHRAPLRAVRWVGKEDLRGM